MHRTQSVDYGIVVSGKIWLVMDSGGEIEIEAGSVCVQRGTNHVSLLCVIISIRLLFCRCYFSRSITSIGLTRLKAWQNRSTENARMMFVLVPSEPIMNKATGKAFELTDTSHLMDD